MSIGDSPADHRGAIALGDRRRFWTLWSAAAVSSLGDGVRYVAFPLLAVSLTTDPRAVAAVFVAGYLPWRIFGLLGGAIVDRHDRRVVMWTTDCVRAIGVAGVAATIAVGGSSILVLAAASFALGTAETLFDNAASAIVPQLVARDGLDRANSRLFTVQTLNTTVIGAPVGAALYEVANYVPAAVDAVSFAVAAALMWSMPGRYRPMPATIRTTVRADIAGGLRWLWHHQFLRTACLLLVIINATIGAAEAVLVLYSRDVLGLSNAGYTALLVTLAIGGVAGTVLAPGVRRRFGVRPVVVVAALGQAGALIAAGLTAHLWITVAAMAVVGASSAAWNVVTVSLRQAVVPTGLLGRVTSSYRVVALAAMPLGAAAGGVSASTWGLHAPYLIGGVVLAVATLTAARWLHTTDAREARPYG